MAILALGTYLISSVGSERFHHEGDPEEFSVLNSAALQCVLILQKSYDICHEAIATRAIFQVLVQVTRVHLINTFSHFSSFTGLKSLCHRHVHSLLSRANVSHVFRVGILSFYCSPET